MTLLKAEGSLGEKSSPPMRTDELSPKIGVDVALSTMWGIGQFNDLNEFFDQGEQMGFSKFELNHQVNSQMLRGVEISDYRISSVHEPCLADISTQTLKARGWLISASDTEKRRKGVRAVRQSIDLASKLGSKVVIIHPGVVDGLRKMEDELRALYRDGKSDAPEYIELKERLVELRTARVDATLDIVRRSLVELSEYAGRFDIRLGLENRYHYSDLPGLDEMGMLLDAFNDRMVGFWYDVGHAQTLDRLGFFPHEVWLHRYSPRMIGVHLHDVIGIDDHHAPGLGEVDWDMVVSYLPKDIIRTYETRPHNSPQEIAASLEFLIEKGCVSYL